MFSVSRRRLLSGAMGGVTRLRRVHRREVQRSGAMGKVGHRTKRGYRAKYVLGQFVAYPYGQFRVGLGMARARNGPKNQNGSSELSLQLEFVG